jgi:hypothetical protein
MGVAAVSRPVSRYVNRSEADRLGKRGSYRLGGLGPPAAGQPGPPRPFRPMFLRHQHRGPAVGWLAAALAATALVAGSTALGAWFMPFVIGLLTGIVMRWGGWRLRVTVPAVAIVAAAGWGLAIWASALRGLPVGPTAQTIARVAGLPAPAAAVIAITLAVSVVQSLAGLWLGRALAPRPARD